MTSKDQMTYVEAKNVIAEMMKETPKGARVRLINLALKVGNLSADARKVYQDAINA